MKTIEMNKGSTLEQEHFILSRLNHENIIKYYEHFEQVVIGCNNLCIVTEYCRVISNY